MRVTKIIREYVTDAVEKAYSAKIAAVREQSENIKTAIEAEFATIMKDAEVKAAAVLAKYPDFNIVSNWRKETIFDRSCSIISQQAENAANELHAERNAKIQTILVTLEMGGTKEELDELIKSL